ncbi:MAG: response regulator transcription factor [Nitrospinae bacterium]|nr:response regulator transcription factor [Nitrospinota bacterium]
MDILCRQLGHADVVDVDAQEDFDKAVAASVDKSSGLGGLLGKSARPKTSVDLFIIDVDSPAGRLSTLVRTLKSQFSGNPRFLVVGVPAGVGEMAEAVRSGATDSIVKPFTREEFARKMQNVLSENPMTVTTFAVEGAEDSPFALPVSKGVPPAPAKPASEPIPANAAAAAGAARRPGEKDFQGVSAGLPKPANGGEAVGKGGSGHSFYRHTGKKRTAESGEPTASLVNGRIDGHYHEKVEVVGGAENCYWARETPGEKVRLEYLTAKGAASGIEAKVVSREEFMHNFYLCEEYGCQILQRLGKWPPKEPRAGAAGE